MNKNTDYDSIPLQDRPIDAIAGDETAHPTVQQGKNKVDQIELDGKNVVQVNGPAESRDEQNIPKDGGLKENFDGTFPKVDSDGAVYVGPSRDKDGNEVVAESESENAEEEEHEDGEGMTKDELKNALDEAGIAYPSKANKADLIKLYDTIPE